MTKPVTLVLSRNCVDVRYIGPTHYHHARTQAGAPPMTSQRCLICDVVGRWSHGPAYLILRWHLRRAAR